jgi:Uma2 family endonuclease
MSTVTKRVLVPTVLRGVPYDIYCLIRDHPGNDGYRMTYSDGALEIMSPQHRHEKGGSRLAMIVRAYTAVFGVDCQGAASTTFRRGLPGELKGKGKEPDESFYFAHEALIRDKDDIDLEVDPPPDLWIEVDNRSSSKGRLPLYAALGVPEVWRYRSRRRALWFGLLEGEDYVEVVRSRSLPKLTTALVLDLLDEAARRGETAWDNWMRGWMDSTLRFTAEGEMDRGPAPAPGQAPDT